MFSRDEYLPECSVGGFHTHPAEMFNEFIPAELTRLVVLPGKHTPYDFTVRKIWKAYYNVK